MNPRKNQEAETVEVLGRQFLCPVCNNPRFYRGKAQLNTPLLSFFNLDWANRSATHITCSNCGHMSWFNH